MRFVHFVRLKKSGPLGILFFSSTVEIFAAFWDSGISVNDLGGRGWGDKRVVCLKGFSSPVSAIFMQRLVLFRASKEGSPPHAIYHSPPDCPWGAEDTTCAKGVPNLLGDEERKGSQCQSQGAMGSPGSGSSAGFHSHSVLGMTEQAWAERR